MRLGRAAQKTVLTRSTSTIQRLKEWEMALRLWYPPPPTRKLTNDNGTSTIWRCISHWTWGFSNVIVSFQGCILNYLDVLGVLWSPFLKRIDLMTSLTGICTEALRFSVALVRKSPPNKGIGWPFHTISIHFRKLSGPGACSAGSFDNRSQLLCAFLWCGWCRLGLDTNLFWKVLEMAFIFPVYLGFHHFRRKFSM